MKLKFSADQVAIVKNWDQFDAKWYSNRYPDVRLASMDPAYHYLWLGQRIGRRPSADSDAFVGRVIEPEALLQFIQGNSPPGDYGATGTRPNYSSANGTHAHAELIDLGRAELDPRPPSIAIHAHCFYANVIPEFATALDRMPSPFDLYVSVPDDATRRTAVAAFSSIHHLGRIDVRVVPNRGRDIAPFVVEFGAALAAYDLVAHIHTKQSLYNKGATDGWRQYIIGGLFPETSELNYLLRALKECRYGIIYPQSFYNLPYMAHTWLANRGVAHAWAARFGLRSIPDGYFDFPAGSMFWARTDAIRPLLEAGLRWDDFPTEQGQTDGTLAHCIERMLGAVSTSRRFRHGIIADHQYRSWSRWRINQFIDRPLQLVHDTIADPAIKVVAFDIFDTLIMRNLLDPDYIRTALHDHYERAGNSNFLDLRRSCEADARNRKGSDVDIHEIYAEMARRDPASVATYDIDFEINMEIASVRPRQQLIDVFNFAKKAGKRVVLASDMFLTRETVEVMLERCGIAGWGKFYLSSEIGFRKDRGDMYSHILATEKIEPAQMLMIGDNERSDLQIPADMGIRNIHLLRPTYTMRTVPRLEGMVPDGAEAPAGDQFLFGALAAENFSGLTFPTFSPENMFGSSARSIGYGLLGPIALAFSQWLLIKSRSLNITKLYFLSREGKFLKSAFDIWSKDISNAIPSAYLVVSRRAVTVPAIATLTDIEAIAASNNFYEEFLDLFLFERYGLKLDDRWWSKIESQRLWRRDQRLTIRDGSIDHLRPLLWFIAPLIFERAKAERTNCLHYLEAMNFSGGSQQAVVDVGYGGTIQRHLNKLLPSDIHGLYMMSNAHARAWSSSEGVIVEGCFASVHPEHGNRNTAMFDNSFILEKMLSANDEQLMSYRQDGGLEFRARGEYVDAGATVRNEMQQGAIDFVKDAVRFRETIASDMVVTPNRVQELFENFVLDRSDDEKAVLSSLLLDDLYCGRGIVSE